MDINFIFAFVNKEVLREIAGIGMALSFMLCFVPQIYKIIKTKSSHDLSPYMIALSLSGYTLGLVYMYLNIYGLWWFMNYTTGIISSGFLFYFWAKYKK
jgi:uncharacterized protein with PQ loop repeat